MGKEQLLQPGLDVDAEPPLERDHALGVPRSPQPTGFTSLAPAREQVERVDAEADRDLAPAWKTPFLPRPPSHVSAHTYLSCGTGAGTSFMLGIGTAATAAFLWLFLREVDVGEAWREITALPGWTMVVALGLVVANVVIMSVAGATCWAGQATGSASGSSSPRSRSDAERATSCPRAATSSGSRRCEAPLPVFVSAGTLFAERLLDGVVLSTWILGALAIGQGRPVYTRVALSAGAALGVVRRLGSPRPRPRRALRLEGNEGFRLAGTHASRARRRISHWTGSARSAAVEARGHLRNVRVWLAADVAHVLGGLPDEFGFDLNLPVGAYFLLEGIGNLALAVPRRPRGSARSTTSPCSPRRESTSTPTRRPHTC